MKHKQYTILKTIEKYQIQKSNNSDFTILSDDFYSMLTHKRHSVNTRLEELTHDGYIIDTANKIDTEVHAVKITDKGYDALSSYYKTILYGIIIYILGCISTLVIEVIILLL